MAWKPWGQQQHQAAWNAGLSRDWNLDPQSLNLFPFTMGVVGQTASWTNLQKPRHVQNLRVPVRIVSLGGESCFILRGTWIVLSKAYASKSLEIFSFNFLWSSCLVPESHDSGGMRGRAGFLCSFWGKLEVLIFGLNRVYSEGWSGYQSMNQRN